MFRKSCEFLLHCQVVGELSKSHGQTFYPVMESKFKSRSVTAIKTENSFYFFKSKATMFEGAGIDPRHFGSRDRRLKAKDFMLKEQPKFAVYRRNYGIRSFLPLDGFCCHKHIINQSDAKTIF